MSCERAPAWPAVSSQIDASTVAPGVYSTSEPPSPASPERPDGNASRPSPGRRRVGSCASSMLFWTSFTQSTLAAGGTRWQPAE